MNGGRHPFRLTRRASLLGGLAALAPLPPAGAAGKWLAAERLEDLIAQAMESDDVKLARPAILGFHEDEEIATRQIGYETRRGAVYYFAVVVPRREDGLLFFKGTQKPLAYMMHRTGVHLRRLVSARNLDGNLSAWSGREADVDFSAQLSFWA